MSDTLTEVRDELKEEAVIANVDPFKEESWANNENVPRGTLEEKKDEKPAGAEGQEGKKEEPVVTEWFKELGFESADEAKTQVVELRKVKETAPKEIEFANEDSKKFFEYLKDGKDDDVFNFLSEKKRLDKILTAETIDEKMAEEVVKLAMQKKYKDFTPDEINYKFSKQFGLPKEPFQGATELDEEFLERKTEWEAKVADIKKDLVIEAKMSRPELEKYKSELILPNIQKDAATSQQTQAQKELEQAEIDKRRMQYLESLGNDYKNFKGFDAAYKNEEVGVPAFSVSYTPTDEEKVALKSELETFDVDGFILSRWFKPDGSPNVISLMEDVYLLRNKDKIHQKIANEVGNKLLEDRIKASKNVNVTGGDSNKPFNPDADKAEIDKMAAFFFSQT